MRIESLTFLRFIAVFIVVIFHFGKDSGLAEVFGQLIISGPQMVTFFFVLSGFVMMVSHYQKADRGLGIYYLSRFARIAPVYFLALLLSVILLPYADLKGIFLSVVLIQAWLPPYPLEPNVAGWSLSVEAFFYLSFPLILLLINRYKPDTSGVFLLAFMMYLLTQLVLSGSISSGFYQGEPSASHDLIYFSPLSHYCSFMLGIAGGLFYIHRRHSFDSQGKTQLSVFFVVILLTGYLLNNPDFLTGLIPYPLVFGASFYAPLFLLLILSVAGSRNRATRIMALPFFVFLGEVSYCIYIIQFPIHMAYDKFLSEFFEFNPLLNFSVFMSLLVAVSAFIYVYFEKPVKHQLMRL